METQWLDEETILRKLPNVTPDEVQAILERRDAEAEERLSALPAAMRANAAAAMNGEPADEGGEGDEEEEPRGKQAGGLSER